MEKTFNYRLIHGLWNLVSHIPLSILYIISDILYYPFYYVVRYRRKLVRKNLTTSLPEKSLQEIIRIEKRFYGFLVDYIFETCKFGTISEKEIGKRMKFTNIDEMNAVLQQGKSVSLYVGHYCNWEWLSSFPLYMQAEAAPGQVYHKLHSALADQLFLNNRRHFGAVNIEMRETLRWINAHARNNQTTLVGYIADQAPKGNAEMPHYTNFLNHKTSALIGAEKITKKYGFEAYYWDMRCVKRGYYEATFVKMHDNPQSLPDYELTDIYFQHLEKTIRQRPEFYLWSHNRFKKDNRLQTSSTVIKSNFSA
ncbi:acetyltransferase [Bacteroidia bacterium]|nr:acetyltransferase [Bacteroidia bacterium]